MSQDAVLFTTANGLTCDVTGRLHHVRRSTNVAHLRAALFVPYLQATVRTAITRRIKALEASK